ncbi:protein phosphatase 2C domain-containing protein, partial [Streptomyces sp. HSW2009]|uniref:protein phosphatase 2C domain-containing protein n=1 Tax=Streptomyces sp. HSW2009 TaxID=3142890 RepID=UPI0032EF528F
PPPPPFFPPPRPPPPLGAGRGGGVWFKPPPPPAPPTPAPGANPTPDPTGHLTAASTTPATPPRTTPGTPTGTAPSTPTGTAPATTATSTATTPTPAAVAAEAAPQPVDPSGARPFVPGQPRGEGEFIGVRPPTYEAQPTALPQSDAADLDGLVPDTALDGARYGPLTLRAASSRGDSARYRGEPRRDALLTARFGTGDDALLLVAVASGARAAPDAHRAAHYLCTAIAGAIGRSAARLADDIRGGRRAALKSGLQRLTDRAYGRLRAQAAERGLDPAEHTAALRCLLLPVAPGCRTRVFFGVGDGGLFRLRDGAWQDLEPAVQDAGGGPLDEPTATLARRRPGAGPATTVPTPGPLADPRVAAAAPAVDAYGAEPASPTGPAAGPVPQAGAPQAGAGHGPGSAAGAGTRAAGAADASSTGPDARAAEPFRFLAAVARPGDALLLCSPGLAEPFSGVPAFADALRQRWSQGEPPGLAAFLTDVRLRVKGYADDRTAVAVWEA